MPTEMKNLGGHPCGIKNPGDFTYEWKDGRRSALIFKYPGCKFNYCCIEIGELNQEPAHPRFKITGHWDRPSITPSIGCDHRCGCHVTISAGVMTP